ncbi:MAG: pyridoxamine kinase [Tissierellia bacterium]|nr:pyridoxamine kinase [Tissierellia bacterium]
MDKKILLVNDIPGYGKVATQAMLPILSHMGYRVFNLPTALISNTLDYGKFEILDTTTYMKHTIELWKELGFTFDCVCTGFLVSDEQGKLLAEFLSKEKGLKVVDPIMGDNGSLYNGVSEKRIDTMKRLCKHSDILIPNGTEASFLSNLYVGDTYHTEEQCYKIIEELLLLGAKSIVITSTKDGTGNHFIRGYDGINKEYFHVPFKHIPVRFPGTGDMFSAVMVGEVLKGRSLKDSVKIAARTLGQWIEENKDNKDKFQGIPVEQSLHILDAEEKNL